MTTAVVTIAIVLVSGLIFQGLRAWAQMRGTRLVTCPETLAPIEDAPDECLVRARLGRWYEGKACTLCGHGIAPIRWHDHKPAFKAHDNRIWEWNEIPAESLPLFLTTARAVCWSCMIAEGFRHDHPDLVIDRPLPPRGHLYH